MLPPVRSSALTNTAPAVMAQGLSAELGAMAAELGAPDGSTTAGNTIQIAGRLGGMMLGGRDGMADSLFMLVDALGRALDMPRRENEPSIAYAQRLAEAIRGLPKGERQEAERLLNLIVEGIRLRLVTEALKNPAGPEAARVVAYLEMSRSRERDLAARITSSYRQNAGNDAAPAPRPSLTAGPAAPSALPQPLRAEEALSPVTSTGGEAPEPTPGPPRAAETGLARAAVAASAAVAGPEADVADATAPPSREAAPAADPESGTAADSPRDPPAYRMLAARADARMLQDILRQAFEGGDTGDPAIRARATAEMLTPAADPEESVTPFRPRARQETGDETTSPDREAHLRGALRATDERRATRQDERRESIFFLKGWKDEATADSLTAQEAADPVRAAVTALRPRTARSASEDPREASFRDRATEMPAGHRLDASDGVEPSEDAPAKDAALPAKARLTAQSLDAAASQMPERPDQLPIVFPTRDGVPYAIASYLPAADFLEMNEAEEARREDQGTSGGETGGEESGDENRDDNDQDENGAVAASAGDSAAEGDAYGEDDAAYGYYQRMAGII